jgi:hypothetical protein
LAGSPFFGRLESIQSNMNSRTGLNSRRDVETLRFDVDGTLIDSNGARNRSLHLERCPRTGSANCWERA